MSRKTLALYPARGSIQVAFGSENGVWGAWYIDGGIEQKMRHQSSRGDALDVYNIMVDLLKKEGIAK